MMTEESMIEAMKLYLRYVGPFVFGPSLLAGQAEKQINNGTVTFLCGDKPFGVTCNHCIEGYRTARENCVDTILKIGNLNLTDIDNRLIDYDASLDIATFNMTFDEIKAVHPTKSFLDFSSPYMPRQDTALSIIGFPGQLVFEKTSTLVEAQTFYVLEYLSDDTLSSTSFIVLFSKDTWKVFINKSRLTISEIDSFGGLSGAPIFYQDILTPKFAGIIFESMESISHGVRARYSNVIQKDGRLNRP
jgi:hypothetical protein